MGMYDYFEFYCPKCGNHTTLQVKCLDYPNLDTFHPGDKLERATSDLIEDRYYVSYPDMDACEKCGSWFVIDTRSGFLQVGIYNKAMKNIHIEYM
jgi:transcription elongation factor Elf1